MRIISPNKALKFAQKTRRTRQKAPSLLARTLNTMKTLSTILLILALCSLSAGCGNESKSAISKYTGDGLIKYLPTPGLLGIDGVAIKFSNIDLSKNSNSKYTLQNLPLGDPYIVFFVVPDPAPLDTIMKNSLNLKFINNGNITREIDLPIGKMINNQGADLNRFYALEGVNGLEVSSELDVKSGDNYSIQMSYKNNNFTSPSLGYLLIERGGYK